MAVRIVLAQESMTAYLSGDIDHHSARGIREEIDEAAQRTCPQELVLNFGEVSFMDSSGIGLVMGRYALVADWDGILRVTGLSAQLNKVMKLAGLDKLAVIDKGGNRT